MFRLLSVICRKFAVCAEHRSKQSKHTVNRHTWVGSAGVVLKPEIIDFSRTSHPASWHTCPQIKLLNFVSFCITWSTHSHMSCLQPKQCIAGAASQSINWQCARSLRVKDIRSTADVMYGCLYAHMTKADNRRVNFDKSWYLRYVGVHHYKTATFHFPTTEITTDGSTNFCGRKNITATSEM